MIEDILLVENSPTQAMRIKRMLEDRGVRVSLAQTGRSGIALAALLLPTAVVLDEDLPDIDGFYVCQSLKDYPATARTPVVMLTLQGQLDDTFCGLDAGADAYVPQDRFVEANLLHVLSDLGIMQGKPGRISAQDIGGHSGEPL